MLRYIIKLCEETRQASTGGTGHQSPWSAGVDEDVKAHAILHERGYVFGRRAGVFVDVCAHRLVLRPQARVEGVTERDLLADILKRFQAPAMNKRWKNE
ncbi:MAG: hypothetical protein ACLVJO_09760 [[Clostridium] scindens]